MPATSKRPEPFHDPATIPDRAAEMVRALSDLISEVCNCAEGELPDQSHWLDTLELARDALARAVAGPEAVEAEGMQALAYLAEAPGLRRALLVFAATMASPAGQEGFSRHLLPTEAMHPPEPSRDEHRRIERAMRAAARQRRAVSQSNPR